MKTIHTLPLMCIGFLLCVCTVDAQETDSSAEEARPGLSRFMMRGFAQSFLSLKKNDVVFDSPTLNPILLFKQSDEILFESELGMTYDNGELMLEIEYATASFILSDFVTLRLGKFFTPFGIFMPSMHPGWIDKFASTPAGLGHHGVLPSNDVGAEVNGGAFLGPVKISYSGYVVNGPQFNDGSDEPDEAGKLHYGMYGDNNKGKAFGGRLGITPFSNTVFEVGVSGMFSNPGASAYENVKATLLGVDLTLVQTISPIKSVVEIKGQYSMTNVSSAVFTNPEDTTTTYTFTNENSAYFVQGSLRPVQIGVDILQNTELALRYSSLKTPEKSRWHEDINQLELSLNYWVDWRTVFKLTVVSGDVMEAGATGHVIVKSNSVFLQWALGF